jgi:hypothetical protein
MEENVMTGNYIEIHVNPKQIPYAYAPREFLWNIRNVFATSQFSPTKLSAEDIKRGVIWRNDEVVVKAQIIDRIVWYLFFALVEVKRYNSEEFDVALKNPLTKNNFKIVLNLINVTKTIFGSVSTARKKAVFEALKYLSSYEVIFKYKGIQPVTMTILTVVMVKGNSESCPELVLVGLNGPFFYRYNKDFVKIPSNIFKACCKPGGGTQLFAKVFNKIVSERARNIKSSEKSKNRFLKCMKESKESGVAVDGEAASYELSRIQKGSMVYELSSADLAEMLDKRTDYFSSRDGRRRFKKDMLNVLKLLCNDIGLIEDIVNVYHDNGRNGAYDWRFDVELSTGYCERKRVTEKDKDSVRMPISSVHNDYAAVSTELNLVHDLVKFGPRSSHIWSTIRLN